MVLYKSFQCSPPKSKLPGLNQREHCSRMRDSLSFAAVGPSDCAYSGSSLCTAGCLCACKRSGQIHSEGMHLHLHSPGGLICGSKSVLQPTCILPKLLVNLVLFLVEACLSSIFNCFFAAFPICKTILECICPHTRLIEIVFLEFRA